MTLAEMPSALNGLDLGAGRTGISDGARNNVAPRLTMVR